MFLMNTTGFLSPQSQTLVESAVSVILEQVTALSIVYTFILIMILLDLWSGVRKAKQRGEMRSSYGYRATVDKIRKYFNMIFLVTVIDFVQILALFHLEYQITADFVQFPFFTYVAALFVGFIELKSIYETNDDKDKAKMAEAGKLFATIAKNHDVRDVLSAMGEFLQEQKKIKTNGTEEQNYEP